MGYLREVLLREGPGRCGARGQERAMVQVGLPRTPAPGTPSSPLRDPASGGGHIGPWGASGCGAKPMLAGGPAAYLRSPPEVS